eukprot:7386955-Prymnesium_polylepis.2
MMRKMFECDWNLARQSHGYKTHDLRDMTAHGDTSCLLEKLIIKNDDNRHGDPTQEVEEVMETLWKYHHGICMSGPQLNSGSSSFVPLSPLNVHLECTLNSA